MYGDVVLELKPLDRRERDPFEVILEKKKLAYGVSLDTDAALRK
jgi:pyruvate,orthophosphate dikinase